MKQTNENSFNNQTHIQLIPPYHIKASGNPVGTQKKLSFLRSMSFQLGRDAFSYYYIGQVSRKIISSS